MDTISMQSKLASARDVATMAADEAERGFRASESASLTEKLVYFYHLKELAKSVNDEVKRLNKVVERFNKGVIPEAIEESGMDLVRVPDVARSFYPLVKHSASMVNKVKAFEWLRGQGAESLIVETVNASTLSAYLKDMLENQGIEPPEDIIRLSTYRITGMSKYTPKEK